MALTDQDIGRIAHLARLELSADESKRMLTRLNGFFGTVEAMCAVDTQGVEPLTQPIAAVQDVIDRQLAHWEFAFAGKPGLPVGHPHAISII